MMDDKERAVLSRNLELLLKEVCVKKAELAKELKVNPSHVTRIIQGTGRASDRLVDDICEILRVNKEWLLKNQGEMYQDYKPSITKFTEPGKTGDRIRSLRRHLRISQEKLGKKINVSRFSVANYESGERNVTGRVINDICREFGVNKEWLLYGTGEMFPGQETEDSLSDLLSDIGAGHRPGIRMLLESYSRMDVAEQQVMDGLLYKMLHKEKEED